MGVVRVIVILFRAFLLWRAALAAENLALPDTPVVLTTRPTSGMNADTALAGRYYSNERNATVPRIEVDQDLAILALLQLISEPAVVAHLG